MSIAKRKPAAGDEPRYLEAFFDRRRDPGGKKEAVLQTAVQMFIKRGYRQTSLDDVARRLKITKPALYYYFHNKEEIYLECYRRGISLIEENLAALREHEGSGLERVTGFIYIYTRLIARDFGRFLVRQDDRELSRKAQAEVRFEKRKIHDSLRGFLEQGIADGSIRECDVKLAAFALAGAINSLAIWFEPGKGLTAEEVGMEFGRSLTQGLANRRGMKLRMAQFEPRLGGMEKLTNGKTRE